MRYPIVSLLVAVCACLVHGGSLEAQSRIGRAGGPAPQQRNLHGGGHGPVSPPAQSPHVHPQRPNWSGGGGRGGWHHHDRGGRSGRRSGGFGFSLGIGGLGFSGGYGYRGWPGYGGYGFDYVPSYPYYGGGYFYGADAFYPPAYDDFGFSYSYIPRGYAVTPLPQWVPPAPLNDPRFADPPPEAPLWNQPLAVEPLPEMNRRIAESSPAAKLRSLRAQGFGDQWFRQQQYQLARDRYKSAVQDAPDRADARFRLGLSYAALGAYELGVREIKMGLELDPSWPSTGDSLDGLFGENNQVAKLSLISRVSTWVEENPGDPDRLFLLGVLHYFNEDMEKALPLLMSARQLGGSAPYLEAFLAPEEPQLGAPVDVPPPAAPDARPVPQMERADEFLPPLPREAEEPQPAPAEEREDAPAEGVSSGPALPPLPQP